MLVAAEPVTLFTWESGRRSVVGTCDTLRFMFVRLLRLFAPPAAPKLFAVVAKLLLFCEEIDEEFVAAFAFEFEFVSVFGDELLRFKLLPNDVAFEDEEDEYEEDVSGGF